MPSAMVSVTVHPTKWKPLKGPSIHALTLTLTLTPNANPTPEP